MRAPTLSGAAGQRDSLTHRHAGVVTAPPVAANLAARSLIGPALVLAVLLGRVAPSAAATFNADAGVTDGAPGSLRAAFDVANANAEVVRAKAGAKLETARARATIALDRLDTAVAPQA